MLLQTWVNDEDDRIFQPVAPYYGRLEELAGDVLRHQQEGRAVLRPLDPAVAPLFDRAEQLGVGQQSEGAGRTFPVFQPTF